VNGGTIRDCDKGISFLGTGEVYGYNLRFANNTLDAETTATTDKLILQNVDLRVDRVNEYAGSTLEITGIYENKKELAELATLISNTFQTNQEKFIQESELDNVLVDYFLDTTKISAQTNTELINGELVLTSTSTDAQYESCDAITDFSEETNTTEGAISLDTTIFHEGTGSLKADYTNTNLLGRGTFRYGIILDVNQKSGSDQDWTVYDELKFWVKSSTSGRSLRVLVFDTTTLNTTYQEYTTSSTNWEQVTIDLTQYARSTVNYVFFQFRKESATYSFNIDDIELAGSIVYSASGSSTSIEKTAPESLDIYELLIGIKYLLPTLDTNITIDLSLDGGSHWLTGIGLLYFENWLSTASGGTIEKADGSTDWDSITSVQIRFNLSTSDTDYSPIVDDYAIIMRVVKS
jgi:hypothetical protein